MGLNKIIENIQKVLDSKKGRQSKRIAALQDLVERLKKKEAKFSDKLAVSKNDKEKKKNKRHLKVCRAHLKKSKAALKSLEHKG